MKNTMLNRLLSVVMVVALLASMLVMPVSATTGEDDGTTGEGTSQGDTQTDGQTGGENETAEDEEEKSDIVSGDETDNQSDDQSDDQTGGEENDDTSNVGGSEVDTDEDTEEDSNVDPDADEVSEDEQKAAADAAKIAEVNALIAALPETVTAENYDAVMAQLTIIMGYKESMGDLWEQIDLETLNAVIAMTQNPVEATDFVAKIGDTGYATLDAAITAATAGDTIKLEDDIEYTGGATITINENITLDLNGHTLTTYGTYGGLILKGGCSLINGTLVHKSTVAAIKAWDVVSIEDLRITVEPKEGKTIGGIVIQANAAGIDTIKNVTIEGVTNGIETYNCGNATENVIGSMENVTINATGTGMLISAPCGTATNCSISGGVSGIEIWIKGNYSATLDVVGGSVSGGTQAIFIHDEFNSGSNIENNGTLRLTTSNTTVSGKLTKTIARAENVTVILSNKIVGYTSATTIWGETWSSATTSYVVKVLDQNGNVMGTTTLNPDMYTFNGNQAPTWHITLPGTEDNDSYWIQEWTTAPSLTVVPTTVELWVDGVKTSTGAVQANGPDDVSPVIAAKVDDDGNILSYIACTGAYNTNNASTALNTAFAEGGNIVLLRNVTLSETLSIPSGATATLDLNGKTLNGAILASNADLTVKNGSIKNTNASVSAIEINAGKLTLTDVNIESARHAVRIDGAVEAVINSGTYQVSNTGNTIHAVNVSGAANVTIENGTFIGPKGTSADSGAAVNVQTGATVNIEGGSFSKGKNDTLASAGTLTVYGGTYDQDPTAYVADGYKAVESNGIWTVAEKDYVAEVNGTKYETLAEALTEAQNGDTIELLWNEGDEPISMAGAVYGKSVTITGTADVDWSQGFLFIGRGGEGNGTITFSNANLTSASNSASYGIHVSGRENGTSDKYDGTLILNNSTIELDYLINKGEMVLNGSSLTVKNGFSVGGRPANETASGADATATLTLNGSYLTVNNHNGMGLGYEAIGVMNVNEGSTFKCTQNFLVTAKGTMNVNGGTVDIDGTLTNNGNINVKDSTVTINSLDNDSMMWLEGTNTIQVEDATNSSYAIRAKDGIVLNNSYIKTTNSSTLRLFGSATFNGGFEVGYLEGASTSKDGVGGTVTIEEGTTVKATYGVEFSNDYTLNGGTIDLDGSNVWGMVFQSGKFDINTNLSVNGNNSYAPIYFTNATATVNSSITQTNSSGEPLYLNNSTVTVTKDASINALSIYDNDGSSTLKLDVTGMSAGVYGPILCTASSYNGALEVINNEAMTAEINDAGRIVLVGVVAEVNGTKYETLAEAIEAANGATVTLLADATLSGDIVSDKNVVINANDNDITGPATLSAPSVQITGLGQNGKLGFVADKVEIAADGTIKASSTANSDYDTISTIVAGDKSETVDTVFVKPNDTKLVITPNATDFDFEGEYMVDQKDKNGDANGTLGAEDLLVYYPTHDNRYTKGTNETLYVECTGFFDTCTKVTLTSKSTKTEYTLYDANKGYWYSNTYTEEGCTKLTMYSSFLNTLAVGEYTVTFYHTMGNATGTIYIDASAYTADSSNPKTGDDIMMAVSVMTLSAAALAVLFVFDRKRKAL